jgi:glyoxylase I family protein
MPELTGVSHVTLTVTDLDKSKEWYTDVFGWQPMMDGDEDGIKWTVGVLPGANIFFGMRVHESGTADEFHPGRTGMDHVAFAVDSRAVLDEWQKTFEKKGVNHSPVQEMPYGQVLNFKDPDNIALEIFAAPGT